MVPQRTSVDSQRLSTLKRVPTTFPIKGPQAVQRYFRRLGSALDGEDKTTAFADLKLGIAFLGVHNLPLSRFRKDGVHIISSRSSRMRFHTTSYGCAICALRKFAHAKRCEWPLPVYFFSPKLLDYQPQEMSYIPSSCPFTQRPEGNMGAATCHEEPSPLRESIV